MPPASSLKSRLYRIIFEADTIGGKIFDITLIVAIIFSTALVCAESIVEVRQDYGKWLKLGEWILTWLFTIEYGLRLYCSPRRGAYMLSFFGIVDLLSILPAYIALFTSSTAYFLVTIRLLRLLRIFRVLKLIQLSGEAQFILRALRRSMGKISIFFYAMLILVVLEGTLMYLIEGEVNEGLSNIPQAVYWAIVTMTTVGYGDVSPITTAGKMLASLIMLSGYAVIAVPTGIVTAHLSLEQRGSDEQLLTSRECGHCGLKGHTMEAQFCRRCGEKI